MCVCLGRISLMLLLFGRCYLVVIKPKAVNVSVLRRNVKRALCKFYISKFITYISVLYKLDFDDTV